MYASVRVCVWVCDSALLRYDPICTHRSYSSVICEIFKLIHFARTCCGVEPNLAPGRSELETDRVTFTRKRRNTPELR